LAIFLASLFFGVFASPASAFVPLSGTSADKSADELASGCSSNGAGFSFSKFLNPLASLVEKVVKDFGYQVALAAPVSCSANACAATCDVGCSGSTPTVSISWEAAPSSFNIAIYGTLALQCYVLTIDGVGRWGDACLQIGQATSYTVSSGLTNNTNYNWSVDAYYCTTWNFCNFSSSVYWGITNQPYGSFTTPDCTPPCVDTSWSPDPSTVCSGTSFTQTSNCGTTRTNTGTNPSSPPCFKSHINLSPTSFTFSGVSGGLTPAGQTLNIANTGNAALNWTGSTNQGWCHLSSASGSIATGGNANITVSVDAPSNVGSFGCNITIYGDANTDNSPQTALVVYNVGSPCHCSRCSTEKKYAWAEFNTTDTTCQSPAGYPVTFTCNCTCTIGSDTSWDAVCQTMCR